MKSRAARRLLLKKFTEQPLLIAKVFIHEVWEVEFVRYVLSGGINTALTYAAYLLILPFIHYQLAYLLTYLLGIVLGYAFNTLLVFRQPLRWRSAVQFPMVSLVQYVISALFLELFIALGMSAGLAGLVSIIPTIPITFVISRWIIKHSQPRVSSVKTDLMTLS